MRFHVARVGTGTQHAFETHDALCGAPWDIKLEIHNGAVTCKRCAAVIRSLARLLGPVAQPDETEQR